MQFTRYPSIANHYAADFIPACRSAVPATEAWVMTEKIHGSNFAWYTDGVTIKQASRSQFLGDDDNFMGGSRVLKERYSKAIKDIHGALGGKTVIAIFGEIYGGSYPHKDVKAVSGAKAIQKGGLYYAPGYCFTAFDIFLCADNTFLPWDQAQALCVRHGMPFSTLLQKGTLDELLAFDVDAFETRIPVELGLPLIQHSQRIAEGVVIRPVNNYRLDNKERVIIKIKSKAFREKNDRKPGKETRQEETATEAPVVDPSVYVNVARVRSVLSKGPERKFEASDQVYQLIRPVTDDIMNEMRREQPAVVALPEAQLRALKKHLAEAVREFLRAHAQELMSESF